MQIVYARRVQRDNTFTLRINCTQRIRNASESIANGQINVRPVESVTTSRQINFYICLHYFIAFRKKNKTNQKGLVRVTYSCAVVVLVSPFMRA